jgi:hypothetical protein
MFKLWCKRLTYYLDVSLKLICCKLKSASVSEFRLDAKPKTVAAVASTAHLDAVTHLDTKTHLNGDGGQPHQGQSDSRPPPANSFRNCDSTETVADALLPLNSRTMHNNLEDGSSKMIFASEVSRKTSRKVNNDSKRNIRGYFAKNQSEVQSTPNIEVVEADSVQVAKKVQDSLVADKALALAAAELQRNEEEQAAKIRQLKAGFETAKAVHLTNIFGEEDDEDVWTDKQKLEKPSSSASLSSKLAKQAFITKSNSSVSEESTSRALSPTPTAPRSMLKYTQLDQAEERDAALERILLARRGGGNSNRSLNSSSLTAVTSVCATPEKETASSDEDLLFPSDEEADFQPRTSAGFSARKPLFVRNKVGAVGVRTEGSGQRSGAKLDDSSDSSKENLSGNDLSITGVGQASWFVLFFLYKCPEASIKLKQQFCATGRLCAFLRHLQLTR